MRTAVLIGSWLTVTFGATGCRDSATAPAHDRIVIRPKPAMQPALLRAVSFGRGQRGLTASAQLTLHDFGDGVRRLINPGDYECDATRSPLFAWYDGKVAEVATQEPDIYATLLAYDTPNAAWTEAFLFVTTDTPQYFGYHGEYTNVLRRTERAAKRFWDIFSADIQLIGMHGTLLVDMERMVALLVAAAETAPGVPVTPEEAEVFAAIGRDAILRSRTLDGGNHPIFTFDAFAVTTFGGPIPDKIIIGDGMLAAHQAVGFGDVGPQVIYAHEFAHHIQFENDYFRDPLATTGSFPERTRYTELMADAMAAYFLTHKRGAAMNRKRVEQFVHALFQVGNCAFTSFGHHGTPKQRMAAARLGFDLAAQAQKQGHILTSEQVHDLFVAAYPDLIAPDAR